MFQRYYVDIYCITFDTPLVTSAKEVLFSYNIIEGFIEQKIDTNPLMRFGLRRDSPGTDMGQYPKMSICPSVHLSVCLLTGLCKYYWLELHENIIRWVLIKNPLNCKTDLDHLLGTKKCRFSPFTYNLLHA